MYGLRDIDVPSHILLGQLKSHPPTNFNSSPLYVIILRYFSIPVVHSQRSEEKREVICYGTIIWLALFYLIGMLPIASADELKDLDLESAEISIIGDDSFVNRRAYKARSGGIGEYIFFIGGYLEWYKMYSNYGFTESDPSDLMVQSFNSNKAELKVVREEIKLRDSHLGEYSWVSKSNNKASCMVIALIFGDPTWLFGGNQRIHALACWSKRRGSKEKLETFMHDLMDRIRLDEGAVNKLKAAGRNSVPAKNDSPATTPDSRKPTQDSSNKIINSGIRERLEKLKQLENDGLITKEEAARKRKEILENL